MDAPSFLMPPVMLTAAISFAVVGSLTPGPNNMMLAASGVHFGVRRSVPHMAGINVGCAAVELLAGFGLGSLFQTWPPVKFAMQLVAALFTLYLAWKIATAHGIGRADAPARPMRFWPAVMFQAVNPKLWAITIAAMTLFVRPDHVRADVLTVALLFWLANIPVMFLWAGFGAGMRDFLRAPHHLRLFNIIMGGLLALSTLGLLHV